jgi:hypothetical protein
MSVLVAFVFDKVILTLLELLPAQCCSPGLMLERVSGRTDAAIPRGVSTWSYCPERRPGGASASCLCNWNEPALVDMFLGARALARCALERLFLWLLFLLVHGLARSRCVIRKIQATRRSSVPKVAGTQPPPRHVALVGDTALLEPLIDKLSSRGVEKITIYDPMFDSICLRTDRIRSCTVVRLGRSAATRSYLVRAALNQHMDPVTALAYTDEPELLLTLDGQLHGYPATALRVTHLYRLPDTSARAIDAALCTYRTTERRQGR